MFHLLAILALKGGATHAAVAHTAATHGLAAHATAAHATTAHAASTAAGHAVIAGVALDATTVGGVAFLKLFSSEAGALTANLKHRLSPDELRKVRDSSYHKVQEAMRRAFTPAEEAELGLICARLGI
jgi:hypothetical protein